MNLPLDAKNFKRRRTAVIIQHPHPRLPEDMAAYRRAKIDALNHPGPAGNMEQAAAARFEKYSPEALLWREFVEAERPSWRGRR